jgi:outer membrane immunogenic protein
MINAKSRAFRGSVAMRRFLLAAMMFGAATGAQAADMPDFLRGSLPSGPAPTVDWRGFYVGAQGGYGSSDENFGGSSTNMVAALISNNVIPQMGVAGWNLGLGKDSARNSGFGGFTGYNSQWDDVVLGLEASYLHGAYGGSSTAQAGPLVGGPLSDTFYHNVTVNSSSAIAISDMATFRARAGYAYGSFLPYLFGGFALGNADISRTVSIQDNYAPTFAGAVSPCSGALFPVCNTYAASQIQHGHLIYGYTAGVGVDVKLIGGLFMRAEWEYARYTDEIDTAVNTARIGLGYKF